MINILAAFPQNISEVNPVSLQPSLGVYILTEQLHSSRTNTGIWALVVQFGALVPVCSPSTTPLMKRLVPAWGWPLVLPGFDMVHCSV